MTKAESFAMQYGYYDKEKKRACCVGYNAGYQQAEKDLELTWEDVQLLYIITEKYMRELDKRIEAFPSSSQEVFEEILRRFREAKK